MEDDERPIVKKGPNEDIGAVVCAFCGTEQPVRVNAKNKKYYNCSNCGVVQPALPFFQEWLLSNAKIYGPDRPDPSERRPSPPPAKGPGPDRRDKATAPAAPPPAASDAPEKQRAGFGMFRRQR